jgi:hypothetical protein
MAKKRFTDPDSLISDLDDLLPAQGQGGSGRGRSKAFTEEPAPDARDIATAVGDKSMAGQYKRKQILLPPAQLQYIQRQARELRISQAELFRWLIDYGLAALDSGVKPEIEVVDVRSEARKKHWTSR